MVSSCRVLVLKESLISALKGFRHHSKLLVLQELGLLSSLLHATERGSGVSWVKKDFHNVNFLTVGIKHFLSSLFGKLR